MRCLKKAPPSRAERKAFSFTSSVSLGICLASAANRARNPLKLSLAPCLIRVRCQGCFSTLLLEANWDRKAVARSPKSRIESTGIS
ncbi:hypothetical protein Nepgr_030460 [Nepenthes gracilis]|uniref:Uncharacterized protein n=1 Tax=Nepenthes gracilis TaxID=150966 RepID=A0AAD3Y3W5_NEPGR|nr:hypothetical protein Nepgr_030460 [Nepenthes gracilis]